MAILERDKPRLTPLSGADKIRLAPEGVLAAAYRKVGKKWLISADHGGFALLEEPDLRAYLEGKLDKGGAAYAELRGRGLVRDQLDFAALSDSWASKDAHLFRAPNLHILVATLRCNHRCLYCHSSVFGVDRVDKDMTLETARKTVDLIFECPSPALIIEFQGGEPLLNWPVVKFVTKYARLKAKAAKRTVFITMVSNFSLMDEEKAAFLAEHEVGVCTSLDGPAALHDKNRLWSGGASHAEAVRWLRHFDEAAERPGGKGGFKPGALMTTTRLSLSQPERIVDEYVALGLPGIFLRPLSPLGFAKRSWGTIGYTVDEWLHFYRRALDYILLVNKRGNHFYERHILTLLTKVLLSRDPGYVDLRSPSGAGFGVLAYDADGSVYTGDEARMVAQDGETLFRVGEVGKTSYNEILDSRLVRAAALASTLEHQPLCSQCTHRPWCGVDPVYNAVTQRSLWGRMPDNGRCRLYMGLFDTLFEKLQDPEDRKVLESWLDAAPRAVPEPPSSDPVLATEPT
ncbi:MAG: His-Xaa-Ser system radical SAM maturase HxsB [Elusimicrobia bacterium]|nr:His-Xaa-Ser system radical SAM maturase HxsB [Elusimicrobiota bacterium]